MFLEIPIDVLRNWSTIVLSIVVEGYSFEFMSLFWDTGYLKYSTKCRLLEVTGFASFIYVLSVSLKTS